MRKGIFVFLFMVIIIMNLSACGKNKKVDNITNINTTTTTASPSTNTQTAETAKEPTVISEYTEDDESSLVNGGRLVKYNDTVVYVGEATGHIFMQDLKSQKITEISTDRPNSLYFNGKWVFYSLQGNKKGVYRLGLDGSVKKLSEDYSLQMCIYKDMLFYTRQIGNDSINGTPQGELYSMDFEGQNRTKLLSGRVKNFFKIHNDMIYYTRLDNRSLNRSKLDGSEETLLAKGRTYIQLVTDNNIYYTDYSNGEVLHKLNLATNENKSIGPWAKVVKCDGKVYIQTKLFNENMALNDCFSIVMVDEESDEIKELIRLIDTGIDMFLTVKGDWVYFGSNNTYKISLQDITCKKETVVEGYLYSIYGDYGYYFYNDGTLSDNNVKRIKL